MTTVTDWITDILQSHVEFTRFCPCGEWMDGGPGEDRVKHNYAEHIAQQIAEALHLTEEWAIEFTDSLDNAPDRYEILDDEPSKEVVDRCRSFPHRGIAHRWVSTWSATEDKP